MGTEGSGPAGDKSKERLRSTDPQPASPHRRVTPCSCSSVRWPDALGRPALPGGRSLSSNLGSVSRAALGAAGGQEGSAQGQGGLAQSVLRRKGRVLLHVNDSGQHLLPEATRSSLGSATAHLARGSISTWETNRRPSWRGPFRTARGRVEEALGSSAGFRVSLKQLGDDQVLGRGSSSFLLGQERRDREIGWRPSNAHLHGK